MAVMVKALGFYSHGARGGIRKVKQHLKYLEYGKTHRTEPEGFTDRDGPMSRADFMETIQAQPEHGVIAHKLVFSMSEEERERLGVNLRDLVKETMAQWSQATGRELKWIGFEHDDPGHPHVHVVIAGYANGRQVGVFPKDLKALKGWAEREKERQAERAITRQEHRGIAQEVERLSRGLERERPLDRGR